MRFHHGPVLFAFLVGAGCAATDASPPADQTAESTVDPSIDPSLDPSADAAVQAAVTFDDRVTACSADPRVVVGAVTLDTCVGADLFFRAPFGGNGRTCATCHRVSNNLTIDPRFIATLPQTDPLFVAENDMALKDLEKPPQMRQFGLILENVDGLQAPRTRFVLRSVPHTLSLSTSVTRPPGSPNPPADRTGWSGDGAPDPGALRDFMTGAIRQHYTRTLARVAGTDFVLATDTELDRIDQYMRRTGRSNELALSSVAMSDAGAETGRTLFQSVGCALCHGNAGANAGGANSNFNTGVESSRNPALAMFPHDGGFGTMPRADGSFGDGTFNVPPLIEAADTGPFFHTATSIVGAPAHNTATATTIEEAIAFYTTPAFRNAPSGFVINLTATQIDDVGRFLRGVNAAFNAAIAVKRITAELAVVAQFHDTQLTLQRRLIHLANVEVGDAIGDLSGAQNLDAASLTSFKDAQTQLTAAQAAADETTRVTALKAARQLVNQAARGIGTNLDFTIGEGSVMF
jgi:mono/diheme cytochrome c family protein